MIKDPAINLILHSSQHMILSREVAVFQLMLPEAVKQTSLASQTGYTPNKPATCFGRSSCHGCPVIPDRSLAAWAFQEGAPEQQGLRH